MGLILIGAVVIGMTLGMLGSGGSAITVPVLIYMVGHGTKESIAESMAIVGLISMVAAIPYARQRQIDWHSVWWFGLPGMLGTLVGAWLGGLASEAIQLLVFAGVLFVAAMSMLRRSPNGKQPQQDNAADMKEPASECDAKTLVRPGAAWLIAVEGLVVGAVTGFVGVGGGFLIVPALVVLGGLPMRLAIGTSLVIIAIKAGVGFAKYEHYLQSHNLSVDPQTILLFASIGIVGSLLGRVLNTRLNQARLRQVFACFLIVLGTFVIAQEANKLRQATPSSSAPQQHQTASQTPLRIRSL